MDYMGSMGVAEYPFCARQQLDQVRASQQVEQVRQQTKMAQRSTAESFERSADSHDRIARSYEKLAELGGGDQYLERRTARHRAFAKADRQIAERLRRMAGDGDQP